MSSYHMHIALSRILLTRICIEHIRTHLTQRCKDASDAKKAGNLLAHRDKRSIK